MSNKQTEKNNEDREGQEESTAQTGQSRGGGRDVATYRDTSGGTALQPRRGGDGGTRFRRSDLWTEA